MPNDCWGLIQFNGRCALEAWMTYFDLYEDNDLVNLIHCEEEIVKFKYYSAWKPNKEHMREMSKIFDIDIVYDYVIEYGMAGEGVLYFRNGEEVLHLDKKQKSI